MGGYDEERTTTMQVVDLMTTEVIRVAPDTGIKEGHSPDAGTSGVLLP